MLFRKAKKAACFNRLREDNKSKAAAVMLAALIGLTVPGAQATDSYAGTSTNSISGASSANTNQAASTKSQPPTGQPPSGSSSGAPNGQPPSGDPPSGAPSGQPPTGQPPSGAPNGAPPAGGPGADTQKYDYSGTLSGAKTADGKKVTISGESVAATKADQNAALCKNGGTLTITGSTLKKTGDSNNADNTNFYGTNATVLAVGEKSKVYVDSTGINSDSEGSNGIFATDKATVYANNVAITTRNSNSARGLDATYGGTIVANNMTISTEGDHCATLATDRGGGTISIANSTLSTKGSGSPLFYSTGNLQADNVNGVAEGSQLAGIEGKNRILLGKSTLESTNDGRSGSDPIKNGVILYQSTSGDADTSSDKRAFFQAVDSTLKTNISDGAMFYVTNTRAAVVLRGTTLDFDSSKVNMISAVANENNWGQSGSNGGSLTFTGIGETLKGDVEVDKASSVHMYLLSGSSWTGGLAKSSKASRLTVNVDGDSTWTLAGDTSIGALHAAKGARIVDKVGKTVTIEADGKTVVKGDSDITLTVKKYSTKVETGEVNKVSSDTIDRRGFDKHFGTDTDFGSNAGATGSSNAAKEDSGHSQGLLARFVNWMKGLFS